MRIKEFIFDIKLFFAGLYFSIFKKKYVENGLVFSIPFAMTDLKFRGRFVLDIYEVEERRYLKQYVEPHATVLELGACLGVVSCLTNVLLKNPENHVVVEANPMLIDWIEQNRDQNGCKFKVEHCMVTNKKENEFYIHDLIVGGSAVRKTSKKVNVEGKTIQDLEKQYGVIFDTLVMDIEGGELYFIRENRGKLRQFSRIFMEVHVGNGMLTEGEVAECEQILQEEGLSLIVRDGMFQIWGK